MDSQPRIPRINVDVGEYTISVEPITPARSLGSSGADEYQLPPNSAFSPIAPPVNRQKTTSRANKESRKLLAHILEQLERRQMPPAFLDIEDELANAGKGNSILEAVKESANVKRLIIESSKSFQQNNEDEEADEDANNEGSYSTDSVYELLVQLRDLILLSTAQGWHLLDDGLDTTSTGPKSSSPFRRSRQSFQERRQRSRSPSPSYGREPYYTAPILLLTCIKIIASLILEECRYKITSPRPSRPPNALQSVILDLARILIHSNAHDPLITAQIGFAIIPAFSTFPAEMHPRLISFFRDIVIQGALDSLRQLQGLDDSASVMSPTREPSSALSESPFVAIHVESATEDTFTDFGSNSYQGPFVHSSYTPSQSPAIHRLSSLIAPILGTILESVELDYGSLNNHASALQFRRLTNVVFDQKFDACIDMLQVIAYHTEKARRAAVSILLTHAPEYIGHRSVSPLRTQDPSSTQSANTPWTSRHQHQFTPWYFDPPGHNSRVGSCIMQECQTCSKTLSGFGLLCPFCLVAVHVYCFEDENGNRAVQYASTAGKQVQRVAMFRFSNLLSSRSTINRGMHSFRPVNTFTLVLCFICQLPLLGGSAQGMNCSTCMLFAHHDCLASHPKNQLPACDIQLFDANRITIEWSKLHTSILDHYGPFIRMSDDELLSLSSEELSIIHASLQVQVQIFSNGLALGSLLIRKGGRSHTPDEFEIHQTIRRLKKRLSFGDAIRSNALVDYLSENNCEFSDHSLLFSWPMLCYVSSQLKQPASQRPPPNSPDLLSVQVVQPPPVEPTNESSQPFDVVPKSHIQSMLHRTFNIRLSGAVEMYTEHLIHCGFINLLNAPQNPRQGEHSSSSILSFPLPYGLDTSPSVETLISAIEACLSDTDLCTNELGFLLLVRRCWPDGMTPEYIISRLLQSIILWILAEDHNLATVLSDHLARQKIASQGPISRSQSTAPTSEGVTIGSSEYLSIRRTLLGRYVTPWLQVLCNYDKQNFSEMVFGSCSVIVKMSNTLVPPGNYKNLLAMHSDNLLRALSRLTKTAVLDSVSDDLVRQWLLCIADLDLDDQSMLSIPRLFTRETELERLEQSSSPWNALITHARESREGLVRSIGWLYLISISKADLPSPLLKLLVELTSSYEDALPEALTLIKSVLIATWSSATPRNSIHDTITNLCSSISSSVIQNITTGILIDESMLFIRLCFSTYLSAAGCDRRRLLDLGLLEEGDISSSATFRKEGGRNTAPEDPLTISADFLDVIAHLLRVRDATLTGTVVKFFALFLVELPSLESHEVDNFILRNGSLLATCVWDVYDIPDQTLSTIRPQLLVQLFRVDPSSLEALVRTGCQPTAHWEQRLSAANRLFLVVLDIGNLAVANQPDTSWQRSVAEIFQIFFTMMWNDPKEEIRSSVEAMCRTLLPAHLDAISFYWDRHLLDIGPSSKTSFTNFLSQLHAFNASWKLLSWKAIFDTLDSLAKQLTETNGIDNVPAVELARVSILCIALHMASSGINIDGYQLLELKYHLVQLLGFKDVSIVPLQGKHGFRVQFGELQELSTASLPCLHHLVRLLDSPRTVELATAVIANTNLQDEKHVTVLIGSPFVDAFFNLFCSLRDWTILPFISLKQLLEALHITIKKHDFEGRPFKHLQQLLRKVMSKSIELLSEEINQELLQIIFSTVQTFVQRCHGFMGSILYTSIEAAAQLVASLGSNGTDVLAVQSKAYLNDVFSMYAQHGIFSTLFKRSLDDNFFWVIGEVLNKRTGSSVELYETLLRDILSRIVESEQNEAQMMLKNTRTYVEKVLYSDMSAQLANYVGHQLSQLSRRAIEWDVLDADCNPILEIMAILMRRNKSIARNFLHNSETILRILLHRSHLKKESLVLLLKEAPSVPKASNEQAWVGPLQLVREILLDALRMKSRVPSPTMTAMVEALCDTDLWPKGGQPQTRTPEMLEAGVYYLQAYNWFSSSTTDDFAASLAISKEVCSALLKEPREIVSLLERCAERLSHTRTAVRAWNTIVMAALSESHPQQHLSSLLSQLPVFTGVHHRGMQAYLGGQGWGGPEFSLVDLNHGYIAIKLWVLLAMRSSTGDNDGEARVLGVWNELWPPFENLIRVLESQSQMDQNMTFTTLLISSIADLFIFLRGLNTPIGLNSSYQIAVLNRLQNLRVETTSAKLTRAFKNMSDTPTEIPQEVLMDQIAKDIIAAERLRLLESKVAGAGTERRMPEGRRREYRVASQA